MAAVMKNEDGFDCDLNGKPLVASHDVIMPPPHTHQQPKTILVRMNVFYDDAPISFAEMKSLASVEQFDDCLELSEPKVDHDTAERHFDKWIASIDGIVKKLYEPENRDANVVIQGHAPRVLFAYLGLRLRNRKSVNLIYYHTTYSKFRFWKPNSNKSSTSAGCKSFANEPIQLAESCLTSETSTTIVSVTRCSTVDKRAFNDCDAERLINIVQNAGCSVDESMNYCPHFTAEMFNQFRTIAQKSTDLMLYTSLPIPLAFYLGKALDVHTFRSITFLERIFGKMVIVATINQSKSQ